MKPELLSAAVKAEAARLGFAITGISAPLKSGRSDFFDWWVDQGFGAGMFFLKRQKARRRDLNSILAGAKSVVVCAIRFPGPGPEGPPPPPTEPTGKVARYVQAEDYHHEILPKLEALGRFIDQLAGTSESKAYVDTGAINERAYAAQGGVGWVGKNAMLIHPEEGSWLWLGEVVTRAELDPDRPMADHCGKCRRCLDACPTGAILEDLRAIDSRKCLSYWNIEHRGPIPKEFHKPMGEWLLGCDICQEVCPWNSHSLKKGRAGVGAPAPGRVTLRYIEELQDESFKAEFRNSAMSRPKLSGLKRNAEIVRGNLADGASDFKQNE
ncbi:MAG: tRNA epoxyqueuosine(34) reductase QueG [Proteobacteria bacterium]|nr:MAG: tRNA epoxyqueuosine(34) reductase QueG [Pseudomonadota bacterium]